MVRLARFSACRLASIGPRPMISGLSALTPLATMRASGVTPSCSPWCRSSRSTAAAPSFSGHALPAVTLPFGTEHRLQRRELLDRRARAGAVVLRDDRAVGRRDRRDLPLEVAVLLRLDRALLRAGAPLVHLLARRRLRPRRRSPRSDPSRCRRRGDRRAASTAAGRPRCAPSCGRARRSNFSFGPPLSAAPKRNRLTVSTPPAMKTSPSPALIACAAMRMVCSDDEQ